MQISIVVATLSAFVTFCACASIDQSGSTLQEASRVKREVLEEYEADPRPLITMLLSKLAVTDPRDSYMMMSEMKQLENAPNTIPLLRKRKGFWQPLGYLPASARIGHQTGAHGDKDKASTNIFRYGK